MGCDIHCYIEHRDKKDGRWNGFGGRINPGRYYAMFSIMAGVRTYDNGPTLFKPKGLPDDISYEARGDNTFYVSDEPAEDHVCKSRAAEWVAKGYSKIVDESWVTNPDWHSHSWLTPDEYDQALTLYRSTAAPMGYGIDNEYFVILDCLRSFEKHGEEARLVFWFDN